MTPTLVARAEPLEPRAVVAEGPLAPRLAARLLALAPARLSQLRVVTAPALVIVVGPTEALPWLDGVRYLGAEPEAPAMLLPTTQSTTPSALLVEKALRRAHSLPSGPFAVLALTRLVPLGRSSSVSRAALAPLLEAAP